ncbi:methyltransferase domain-containing protein [Pseudodesulfovibrio cashew]|uniref:Methyltransferase domain-containing protein n=1 Tax=Pseudodesulfovibrio cashew TaxID=2678688 RepID=A0A6I6J8P2_9BACT|nr:class I SAM-dependent methyltransferase [Pseudodesulfovibrio cashew]QGY38945.1 methyltransferase domain-containing protein [Pseudodesulfovibrio cashew]
MISKNKILDKVYTARTHAELMDAYKDWAGDYEEDTVGGFGYVAPKIAADVLHGHLDDPTALILDAGCGTGLVGEALSAQGYSNMDALDYSPDMLARAERKGLYHTHLNADLSRPLDIADDSYDAVVSAGTFTYGHVDASALGELARITKPGGFITITIRDGAFDDHDYPEKMRELETKRTWKQIEIRDEDYLQKEGVGCKVCTFQII